MHATTLPDGFAGLPRPDFAAVAVITLTWLAWTIGTHAPLMSLRKNTGQLTIWRAISAVHLIWILVQEETAWLTAEVQPEVAQWPSTVAAYTPEPTRRHPTTRAGRLSAKIVAVQHGSPPELWAKNKGTARERERAEAPLPPQPTLQPARPTYDPRARQMRDPPPVKTSRYQWYITPGEAV